MAATFTVTNDQTLDTKDVTAKEWEKLQLQGYRILDVAAYDNAMTAAPEPKAKAAEPAPAPAKAEPAAVPVRSHAAPSHTEFGKKP